MTTATAKKATQKKSVKTNNGKKITSKNGVKVTTTKANGITKTVAVKENEPIKKVVKETSMADNLVRSVGDYLNRSQQLSELNKVLKTIGNHLGMDSMTINYNADGKVLLSDLTRKVERMKDAILEGNKIIHLIGCDVLSPSCAMYYYEAIKSSQIHSKDNLADDEFWHLEELREYFLKSHVHEVKSKAVSAAA